MVRGRSVVFFSGFIVDSKGVSLGVSCGRCDRGSDGGDIG